MPRNILGISFFKLTAGRMLKAAAFSVVLSGLILPAQSNASGGTLISIRAVVEALGGTVSWNASEKKVTTILNGKTIELWIGQPQARVNGVSKWIDETNHSVTPVIIDSKTMLPSDFVAANYKLSPTVADVSNADTAIVDKSISSPVIVADNPSPTVADVAQPYGSSDMRNANSSPIIPKLTTPAQSSLNMPDVLRVETISGQTTVPIRVIVEAFGGTVAWDAAGGKVTTVLNGKKIELWIGKSKALVNGVSVWIDETNHNAVPIIINSRTMLPPGFVEKYYSSGKPAVSAPAQTSSLTDMIHIETIRGETTVPIRAKIEERGGTVAWDNTKKKVTIILNGNTIEMWIGKPQAKVNGVLTWIDPADHSVAPQIVNSRTVLPLSFANTIISLPKKSSGNVTVSVANSNVPFVPTGDYMTRAQFIAAIKPACLMAEQASGIPWGWFAAQAIKESGGHGTTEISTAALNLYGIKDFSSAAYCQVPGQKATCYAKFTSWNDAIAFQAWQLTVPRYRGPNDSIINLVKAGDFEAYGNAIATAGWCPNHKSYGTEIQKIAKDYDLLPK